MKKMEQPDLPGFEEENKDENISGLKKPSEAKKDINDKKPKRPSFAEMRKNAKEDGGNWDGLVG